MILRQINPPELEATPCAQLSPDGKRMLCVRYRERGRSSALAVLDLSSGQEETLVDSSAARWMFGAEGLRP
jgi:hypothetical protein